MSPAQSFDVVVIGAGPAGAVASSVVAGSGLDVCVVERAQFPRFAIGESLLPRCLDRLEQAGLLDAVESRGYLRKIGSDFFRRGERCHFDFDDQFGDNRDHAYHVPRADFDQTLIDAAAKRGVEVRFDTEVTGIEWGPNAAEIEVESTTGASTTLTARFVIDASGFGRVLPRLLQLDAPSGQPQRHALFAWTVGERRPPAPDDGRTSICLHPDGAWIWIIPFADDHTSVGVVAPPEFFDAYPTEPEERLRAILAEEFTCTERLGGTPLGRPPRTVGGYSVAVDRTHGPGYCLVGNATEFLDPVFSSGVTLAAESGYLGATTAVRELNGEAVDWETEFATPMQRGIDVFRTFVDRWYDGTLERIFFATDKDPRVQQQITAILAGYVWDTTNPFVAQHSRRIRTLDKILSAKKSDR